MIFLARAAEPQYYGMARELFSQDVFARNLCCDPVKIEQLLR